MYVIGNSFNNFNEQLTNLYVYRREAETNNIIVFMYDFCDDNTSEAVREYQCASIFKEECQNFELLLQEAYILNNI